MKKSKLLLTLFSLVALSSCSRGNSTTGNYYKVTFVKQDGKTVTQLYKRGFYPTPDGYYQYLSNVREPERYEPSLRQVYSDTTYYVRSKITILDTPRYGDKTKYFKYNERVSFYDYGIEEDRYTDYPIYASKDLTFHYRYKVTFTNVRDASGDLVSICHQTATYGSYVQYPYADIYPPTCYDDLGYYEFAYWIDYNTGNHYYDFTESFYVTYDMELFATYNYYSY